MTIQITGAAINASAGLVWRRHRCRAASVPRGRAVAIGSGLGGTTTSTWLKVPAAKNPARMLATTSLPALILATVLALRSLADAAARGPALLLSAVEQFEDLLLQAAGDPRAVVRHGLAFQQPPDRPAPALARLRHRK